MMSVLYVILINGAGRVPDQIRDFSRTQPQIEQIIDVTAPSEIRLAVGDAKLGENRLPGSVAEVFIVDRPTSKRCKDQSIGVVNVGLTGNQNRPQPIVERKIASLAVFCGLPPSPAESISNADTPTVGTDSLPLQPNQLSGSHARTKGKLDVIRVIVVPGVLPERGNYPQCLRAGEGVGVFLVRDSDPNVFPRIVGNLAS